MEGDSPGARGSRVRALRSNKYVVWGAVSLLIILLVVVGVVEKKHLKKLWGKVLGGFEQLGPFATVPMALLCFVACVAGGGIIPVEVASAAIFQHMYGLHGGAGVGIATCCFGTYLGCVAAFVLGRTCCKPRVERKLEEFEVLRKINKVIESEGWKFAFVMRLSPFLPVSAFNYACSMTSMSFLDNAFACVGSMPTVACEVWAATLASNLLSGSKDAHKGNNLYFTIGINVAVIVGMIVLFRKAKRKYDALVDEDTVGRTSLELGLTEAQRGPETVAITVFEAVA